MVHSPADGYTLLLGSSANTINASLFKMAFDFSADLAPIAPIADAPGIPVAQAGRSPARCAEQIAQTFGGPPD